MYRLIACAACPCGVSAAVAEAGLVADETPAIGVHLPQGVTDSYTPKGCRPSRRGNAKPRFPRSYPLGLVNQDGHTAIGAAGAGMTTAVAAKRWGYAPLGVWGWTAAGG